MKNINDIIQSLLGTCKTAHEICKTHDIDVEELTEEDWKQIDNEIFLCESCGWWCEIGEQQEDGNCEDCQDE